MINSGALVLPGVVDMSSREILGYPLYSGCWHWLFFVALGWLGILWFNVSGGFMGDGRIALGAALGGLE